MTPGRRPTEYSLGEAFTLFEKEARRGVVDTGRYPCPYIVWGEGPPVAIIHGMSDDLLTFVPMMARLKDEFQFIAYNQPTGRTGEGRINGYCHQDLVDDLLKLLDHLGIAETTLLGSSFGSTIAMKAMHDQPRRIDRAILQGGFAHRPLRRGEWWLSFFARCFPGTMRSLPLRYEAMLQVHSEGFKDTDPDYWEFFLKQSGKPLIRSVARWALLLHGTDLSTIVPAIRQPILLLCGDRDPLVPHSCQEYLFNHLPNASMFVVDNCGHFPMLTHTRAFVETLRKFMCMTECAAECRLGTVAPTQACAKS